MAERYTRPFTHSIQSAFTVDDEPILLLEFTGASDSFGFYMIDSDGLKLFVGTDSDDNTASDTTLESDTTAGSDTDYLTSDWWLQWNNTDYTLSDVQEIVNYSPNWKLRLVTGLPEDVITTTDATAQVTDATAVTRGTGAVINRDKSDTDGTANGSDSFIGTSTNLAQVRVCIGPEADTAIADPLLRRSEKVRDQFDPQPTAYLSNQGGSALTSTRTSEGPMYAPLVDMASKIDTLNITGTTGTDIGANDVNLYFIAHKAGEAARLLLSDPITASATSDTVSFTTDYNTTNTGALVSRPGERLIVLVASTETDLSTDGLTTLTVSATGRYGEWDALTNNV